MRKAFPSKQESGKRYDIDVVADSDYSTVSKAYSRAFRMWRNREDNNYAFRCRRAANENIYIEGVGYQSPDPAVEERRTMQRVHMVIGIAILLYLMLESLSGYLLVAGANLLGMEIDYSYSNNAMYGPELPVLIILMFQTFLKYLIPVLIFRKMFRLPRRVAYHLKPDNPHELPVSTCLTLALFVIVNIWMLFSSNNPLAHNTIGTAYYAVSYMQAPYGMIYLIYKLVVVSIMSELLIHGEVLHVLRQFGDWYAILMTALLNACLNHSFITLPMDLTFAVVAGIAVLRSGSLLPAILNRMLCHLLMFGFFWIRSKAASMNIQMLLMLAILTIGILGSLLFIRPRRTNPALLNQKHYLSPRERLRVIWNPGPLSVLFILCLVTMVIEVIF